MRFAIICTMLIRESRSEIESICFNQIQIKKIVVLMKFEFERDFYGKKRSFTRRNSENRN